MEVALLIALEDSERGRTLRQSSLFAGILTEAERLAFLNACGSVARAAATNTGLINSAAHTISAISSRGGILQKL